MVQTRNHVPDTERQTRKYRNWDEYGNEDEDEPDSPFVDLIQRDPTVCDNCFAKKYTRVSHEWWRGSFGWLDYERWIPLDDKVVDVPDDNAAQGTKLACADCGMRYDKIRPISKSDIIDYAKNISETLDQKEVRHDYRVLLHEVERRNTSQNQGKQDSHVFKPAVQRAIDVIS